MVIQLQGVVFMFIIKMKVHSEMHVLWVNYQWLYGYLTWAEYIFMLVIMQHFFGAWMGGHLEMAQRLYSLFDIEIHSSNNDLAFQSACSRGHLQVAQWLYSLGGIDINVNENFPFESACVNGHLSLGQWRQSLGAMNTHVSKDDVFYSLCIIDHFEIAQWL
jgi:hypothetical protein